MTSARLIVDADFAISDLDRRVFGTFVEHMGRCVYTGIFEPGRESLLGRGVPEPFRKAIERIEP